MSAHFPPLLSLPVSLGSFRAIGPRILYQLVGRLAACTWLANHREWFSSTEIRLHQSQYRHYRGHPFESPSLSVQVQVSLEPLWHSSTHTVPSFWSQSFHHPFGQIKPVAPVNLMICNFQQLIGGYFVGSMGLCWIHGISLKDHVRSEEIRKTTRINRLL